MQKCTLKRRFHDIAVVFASTPNCVSYLATLPASFGGIDNANIVSHTSSFEAGYVSSFFQVVLTKSLQMFVAR